MLLIYLAAWKFSALISKFVTAKRKGEVEVCITEWSMKQNYPVVQLERQIRKNILSSLYVHIQMGLHSVLSVK